MGDLWLDSLSLPPELTPTPDSVSPKPYQQVERYLAWEEDRVPSCVGDDHRDTHKKGGWKGERVNSQTAMPIHAKLPTVKRAGQGLCL